MVAKNYLYSFYNCCWHSKWNKMFQPLITFFNDSRSFVFLTESNKDFLVWCWLADWWIHSQLSLFPLFSNEVIVNLWSNLFRCDDSDFIPHFYLKSGLLRTTQTIKRVHCDATITIQCVFDWKWIELWCLFNLCIIHIYLLFKSYQTTLFGSVKLGELGYIERMSL